MASINNDPTPPTEGVHMTAKCTAYQDEQLIGPGTIYIAEWFSVLKSAKLSFTCVLFDNF